MKRVTRRQAGVVIGLLAAAGMAVSLAGITASATVSSFCTKVQGCISMHFADASVTQADDSMKQGAKFADQATWVCENHKNPKKDDIVDGNVALGTFAGDQYLYLDFTRVYGKGDSFIFFEFNGGTATLASGCTNLAQRRDGDLAIAFQMTNGGKAQALHVQRWTCALGHCSFHDVALGQQGTDWAMSVNDPNGPTHAEAVIDLSSAVEGGLSEWSCDEFATVFMGSHASTSGHPSEMKDIVQPIPFAFVCPLPSPSPSSSPSPSPSASPSPSPVTSPSPVASPSPSPSPVASASPSPSVSPSPHASPSPSPTPVTSPSPAASLAPSASPSPAGGHAGQVLGANTNLPNTGSGPTINWASILLMLVVAPALVALATTRIRRSA